MTSFFTGLPLCRHIIAPSGLKCQTASPEGATSVSDGHRPSKKDDESTTKTIINKKDILYLK